MHSGVIQDRTNLNDCCKRTQRDTVSSTDPMGVAWLVRPDLQDFREVRCCSCCTNADNSGQLMNELTAARLHRRTAGGQFAIGCWQMPCCLAFRHTEETRKSLIGAVSQFDIFHAGFRSYTLISWHLTPKGARFLFTLFRPISLAARQCQETLCSCR